MIRRIEWTVIGFIVAAYLVIAWQYTARTPDWQAPDEPAHYNYVRQIVDDGALPVLEMGDWQQDYQEEVKASGFRPDMLDRLDTIQYEDHQPPLYYLLQTPVYAATDGDLRAMRLLSVLLGAGVVLCAWAVLWTTFPTLPCVALAGAGFVAFLPQHLSILASVSNDALAELIVGLTLLATAIYLGNTRDHAETPDAPARRMPPLVLGLLVGLALWTKTTIYFLGGIAVLAVLLRWRRVRWDRRTGIAHLAAVIVPALIMGGLWWGRNVSVYGGSDVFGLQRHDEVTVGQTRTDEYINVILGGSERQYVQNFVETSFRSFWGQFGWMALPMPTTIYRLLLLFTAGSLAGLGIVVWRRRWLPTLDPAQREMLIIFAVVIVLVFAAYVFYNRDFVQFQGRYVYPALIPLGFLMALGLAGWTALLEDYVPALEWLSVLVMIGLAVFALYALDTYIVPNLPSW
jgi:4-amino-4-deoxy-L-arabinose transferase-like glycosyltransferase